MAVDGRVLCILTVFLFCSVTQQVQISLVEKAALLSLRSTLGLRAKEWPIKADPCTSWVGIECINENVTGINISGFRRTRKGSQSATFSMDAIQNISSLLVLNTSHFALPGQIPEWFGIQLSSLEVLDMRSCSITGNIPPTLGNLVNVSALYLSDNRLNGKVPLSVWLIPALRYFDVSSNNLTGTIPEVNRVTLSSSAVNLSTNLFYGIVGSAITRFGSKDLSNNFFDGTISMQSNTSVDGNCIQNAGNQKSYSQCASFYKERGMIWETTHHDVRSWIKRHRLVFTVLACIVGILCVLKLLAQARPGTPILKFFGAICVEFYIFSLLGLFVLIIQ